jgi:leader peptidase (prepilin peptidase) / N-methyltransferase
VIFCELGRARLHLRHSALKRRGAIADQKRMEAVTFAGVLGAIMGSFLNVVAYRLPRRESLVAPRSRCTACGAAVRAFDNVPVLSWLVLRGRCRSCAARISPRYPLVEAGTALLCVGAVLAHDSAAGIALAVTLVLLLVPAALIDLEHRIIPNRLTAAGALLALGLGTALDPSGEPGRLLAGAAAGGFLLVAALAYPGGMGMGDVKLAGVMGLLLGAAVAPALLIALVAGVLVGVVIVVRKNRSKIGQRETDLRSASKTAIPFGPFLAFGGVVAVLAGQPIVAWYTTHFLH